MNGVLPRRKWKISGGKEDGSSSLLFHLFTLLTMHGQATTYTCIHKHNLKAFMDTPFFIYIHILEQSLLATCREEESTHVRDKLELSQSGDSTVFPLFVVPVCLAVVSLDDYQNHKHSSHNPVRLPDMGLPAGKVKSEHDQRRWMPEHAAVIVQTSQEKICSSPFGEKLSGSSCGYVDCLLLLCTFQKTCSL